MASHKRPWQDLLLRLSTAEEEKIGVSTPNGFDRRWIPVINQVLEDRGSPVRIDDITEREWERFIAPYINYLEEMERS